MKVYEFGREHARTLLMFQCAAEPVWVFEAPARALARHYHVYLAAADGHDPSEDTTFVSVEDYARKAVSYLGEHDVRHLDALYGISMGGAAVMYLLASRLMPVTRAIVDAGITPYPYPRWACRLIALRDFCLVPLGTMSMGVMKMVSPPAQWTQDGWEAEEFYRRVYDFVKHHFSARTNYNVFWSANNYEMPDSVPYLDTEIEYWYGTGEAKARRADIAYVRKTFPQTRFRELKGYAHAQLVIVHPEEFCRTAMQFLGEG